MTDSVYTDRRAQSIGIAALLLALMAGAFLIWILSLVSAPLLDHAANATADNRANAATGWFRSYVDYVPAIFLLIGFFGTLVLAIYQREVR